MPQVGKKLPILHVVAVDFDGFLLPVSEEKKDEDDKSEPVDIPLEQINKKLLKALKKQTQYFNQTIGLIASSRNSKGIDDANVARHRAEKIAVPTSCFKPIRQIIEQEIGGFFHPFLMPDIYFERPDGFAFSRIMASQEDSYHYPYVFDESKVSLLYTLMQLIANDLRSCDWVQCALIPTAANLKTFPIKSNAAYVSVVNGDYPLPRWFYINKIEGVSQELSGLSGWQIGELNKFGQTVANKIEENHEDTFIRDMITNERDDQALASRVCGLTLTEEERKDMAIYTRHTHLVKDYPILFDFYDDLAEILEGLTEVFDDKQRRSLIPSNMILRLNRYSANRPETIAPTYATIRGKGGIDLNYRQTVVNFAKQVLGKKLSQEITEADCERDDLRFDTWIKELLAKPFFASRTLTPALLAVDACYKTHAETFHCTSSLEPEDSERVYQLQQALSQVSRFSLFKGRKRVKGSVLDSLMHQVQEQTVSEALQSLDPTRLEEACYGVVSHQVSDLINDLKTKYPAPADESATPPSVS